MPKIAISIICMIFVGTFFVVNPNTVRAPPGDYIYVEIGGVAQIERYTGAGGAITIPSTLGGFPTGIIGHDAFNNANGHNITSVIIPNSVTTINDFAFYGCTLLTSVTIGSGVINIGQFVFQYCSILTSIALQMHDPPTVCDCWINNTSSALRGHSYADSNFPDPGEIWEDGKLMMGANINLPPTAEFTYNPSSPTDLDIIQFTDTSTDDGTITSWNWDFDDASTSILQNPTHDYTDDGTYTVILTVTDDEGLSNSLSINVVVGNVPPTANFTFSPTSPTAPNNIQFTDTSTDADGMILLWSWEFGDGTTSSLQNPTHQYTEIGTYVVNFRVADDDWADTTASKEIVVSTVGSKVPPTAEFTYSPSIPTNLDAIYFTDASTDPDGMIMSWRWNFGDGTNSTSKNPQHNYATPGQYIIVLEVTDNTGAKESISKKITIYSKSEPPNNPPTANFSFYPSTAEINETIQFTDTSIDTEGTITAYLWNFGDGTNSTSKNPKHKYTTNGTYTITLAITDDDEGTDLTSRVMIVHKDSTDTNGTKGTPGFKLFLIVCAIIVAMVLWTKKKQIKE